MRNEVAEMFFEYIQENPTSTILEISNHFNISVEDVVEMLNILIDENRIKPLE